jgi:septal ring factor EnvC (AmiA/AmiB activator)
MFAPYRCPESEDHNQLGDPVPVVRVSSRILWSSRVIRVTNPRSRFAMVYALASPYRSAMDQEVREFLEQLAGMISREFARINDRFEGVDARFDQIDARFDQVDARFDQVDARFERIESRLDGIDARLEGHDRRLDHLDAEVHDLRREMKSEFVLARESIQALTTRVEALEQPG